MRQLLDCVSFVLDGFWCFKTGRPVLGKLGPGQLGRGQLGPGQLGPGQLGPGAQLSAPKNWTVGPRGPTVRGPTVRGPIRLEPWPFGPALYF